MTSIIRYETMSLDELYSEAFHQDNKLALALFEHIDGQYDSGYDEGHIEGWNEAEAHYTDLEGV